MGTFDSILVSQADYLLFLHGLLFTVVGAVCLGLARLDRHNLPWRALGVFAFAWGISEWLEMLLLGMDTGPVLPVVQVALVFVALAGRAEFGRRGLAATGGARIGGWITVLFGLAGASGALRGSQGLWISVDLVAAVASLWDVWVLLRYRARFYPRSRALLVAAAGFGFYLLGTGIPVLHITWFLPGIAGGFPEGQVLWIFSAGLFGLGLMAHRAQIWRMRFGAEPLFPFGITHWKLVGMLIVILLAGWGAALWGEHAVVEGERENLLQRTRMVANALNPEEILMLGEVPAGAFNPNYLALQRRFEAMAVADPDIRVLRAVGLRDGRFIVSLDGSPEGTARRASAGAPLIDPPPGLRLAFEDGQSRVTGPYAAGRGPVISGFVPQKDPAAGHIIQVIQAEMKFSHLYQKVASHRLVYILLTLLTALLQMGVFTFRQMEWEASAALRIAEQRYASMFQSHSAAMLLLDPATSKISDANQAAADLFGRTKESLIDGELSDLTPTPMEELKEQIEKVVRREITWGEETIRKSGEDLRDVEWHGVPIHLGDRMFLFIIIHDITERKRAERGRRHIESQMVQAQKLESLGVMAGGIAHDFNNILQGILGHTELALRATAQDAEVRKRLVGIRESSQRAADLCQLMLAYSGKGALVFRALDLGSLMRETIQMVEASIPRKISIACDLADPLPKVEGDAAQIRQVIMNLLLNAAEAIGEAEGTILATARGVDRPCGSTDLDRARLWVLLEVRDSGCGMDEATRVRIFEPFFTTKFTGRGLGLAAVQGIVRGHDGVLSVESAPGAGTIFRVYFPACGEAAVAHGAPPSQTQPVPGALEGRILLVDDEEEVRNVGLAMLAHLGLQVAAVESGEKTLGLLEAGERFDAVLLDATMPGIDGAETLRRIRKGYPDLPVVLVSGYDEAELARRFSYGDLAGFLHKPFTMSSLGEVMGTVLRGPR
jgi:PAS domain S-box-containing protein